MCGVKYSFKEFIHSAKKENDSFKEFIHSIQYKIIHSKKILIQVKNGLSPRTTTDFFLQNGRAVYSVPLWEAYFCERAADTMFA